MPLYEYKCQSCGRLREALQKMGDPPLVTCEVCGGELKRLVSAPAVQFKGTGWYVTDYAKKSGSEAGRPAASAADKGGAAESSAGPAEKVAAAEKPAGGGEKSAAAAPSSGGSGSSSGSPA